MSDKSVNEISKLDDSMQGCPLTGRTIRANDRQQQQQQRPSSSRHANDVIQPSAELGSAASVLNDA